MTDDEFDRAIRACLPGASVTPERLDHLVDTVLASVAAPRRTAPSRLDRLRAWFAGLAERQPALAYSIPLALAAGLGVLTGGLLTSTDANADPIANLIITSSTLSALVM